MEWIFYIILHYILYDSFFYFLIQKLFKEINISDIFNQKIHLLIICPI